MSNLYGLYCLPAPIRSDNKYIKPPGTVPLKINDPMFWLYYYLELIADTRKRSWPIYGAK